MRDARLGLQRSAFTLLAFVADTDGAQAFVPQTILGSKRVLPQRVAAEHIGLCVLSAKCACLSAAVLCRILRLLGVALRHLRKEYIEASARNCTGGVGMLCGAGLREDSLVNASARFRRAKEAAAF